MRTICVLASVVAVGFLGLSACGQRKTQQSVATPRTPAGEIVQLPDAFFAGGIPDLAAATITNPFDGNPDAIARGHQLFLQMNCASCHGYTLTGGMGPSLTDSYWRYGGTPAAIFQTIYTGRPQGMPSWRYGLSTEEIWALVAYIQSMGGTVPASKYEAGLNGDVARPTRPAPPPPPPDQSTLPHNG
jgi:mono/diheme cytochrome c family protein